MYHKFVLVQKIEESARLKVYLANKEYINWTYERVRLPLAKTDTPLFPIIIDDADVHITEKPVGRETSCIKVAPNKVRFSDDYGVPEGFLICITGPVGYMPTIVKFKKKSMIFGDDYNNRTPGYYEVLTNKSTRQASILMHTLGRTYFGISIDFEVSEGGFDRNIRSHYRDPFDMTLSLINGKVENVTASQVNQLIPDLSKDLEVTLVEVLNELVELLKNSNEAHETTEIPSSIKNKVSKTINNIVSSSSSIVTIVDSYSNKGFVAELIKAVFNTFS